MFRKIVDVFSSNLNIKIIRLKFFFLYEVIKVFFLKVGDMEMREEFF